MIQFLQFALAWKVMDAFRKCVQSKGQSIIEKAGSFVVASQKISERI